MARDRGKLSGEMPAKQETVRRILPAYTRPPRPRPDQIPRPALCGKIVASALSNRLTLLSAESGFGKTTLLADVHRVLIQQATPTIWISLSQKDADPAWLPFVLAEQLAALFHEAPHVSSDFAELANRHVAEQPVVVAIDNWNFIESEDTNSYFNQLLTETEGLANFVITSRSVPGFNFETYQLSGDFAGFSARDLSFTTEEAFAFLKPDAAGLSSLVQFELIERTEGWAAGLQLLRLALRDAGSDAREIASFSGSRAEVAGYLNKSIFAKLPPERQAFLCDLAQLEVMSVDLVSQLFEDDGCVAEFQREIRDNSFLSEESEGRHYYRFHSLFRDFLLSQRSALADKGEGLILGKASLWHEARGELDLAVPYAIQAGDASRAAGLLEAFLDSQLHEDGRTFLFTAWVEALLEQGAELSQKVRHWYLWCLVFSGRWRDALATRTTSGDIRNAQIEAVIAAFSDDQSKLVSAVEAWAASSEDKDHFSSAVMHTGAAIAHLARGDVNRAVVDMHRAEFAIDRTDSAFGRVWVMVVSAFALLLRGRASEAEAIIRKCVQLADRNLGRNKPMTRIVRLTAAVIAWQRGARDTARSDLEKAAQCDDEHGLPVLVVMASEAAHDLGAPCEDRRVETGLQSSGILFLSKVIALEQAQLTEFNRSKTEGLQEAFAVQLEAAKAEDAEFLRRAWGLDDRLAAYEARNLILAGNAEAALRRISPALSDSQRYGRGLSMVKLSLLKVAALNRLDQRSAALRTLIQTADVAVAGGIVQPFLSERELIEDLLPALIEAGERAPVGNDPAAWREFVRALGGNLGDDILTPVIARTADGNLQLTDRERDMLGYLDAGLSNREIGDRLGIQVPTVKWHLHNLFSKIGVRNRSSAVRFARDNHLL